MSNVKEYKDLLAFHPGYYVSEIIEEMGITQAEFAMRIGTNTKTLSCLVNGQANITNDLAKKLSVMTGTDEEMWLNLQSTYDKKLIEIQKNKDSDEQARLLRLINYAYFINNAGVRKTGNESKKIENLCRFFKVSDLRIMLDPNFLTDIEKAASVKDERTILNSKAWLQTAINFSQKIETQAYDPEMLKSFLPELRSMTVQKPNGFLPRMKKIFADCGVAFVLLPELKESEINGAVKWLNENKAILAMNESNTEAYAFWLLLFSEIRCILQKKIKTTYISYSKKEMLDADAYKFAANYLIPAEALRKFAPSKNTSDDEIAAFAKSIGVHPGVVAGRLLHDGILSADRCEKFAG